MVSVGKSVDQAYLTGYGCRGRAGTRLVSAAAKKADKDKDPDTAVRFVQIFFFLPFFPESTSSGGVFWLRNERADLI